MTRDSWILMAEIVTMLAITGFAVVVLLAVILVIPVVIRIVEAL